MGVPAVGAFAYGASMNAVFVSMTPSMNILTMPVFSSGVSRCDVQTASNRSASFSEGHRQHEQPNQYRQIGRSAGTIAGQQPVPGYETQTDEAGMYRLETEHLPPSPKDDYGRYYVIVEKEGYRSYEMQMGFGFMNGYLKNTVVLKPLPRD